MNSAYPVAICWLALSFVVGNAESASLWRMGYTP